MSQNDNELRVPSTPRFHKPAPVRISQEELVRSEYLDPDRRLPLLLRPQNVNIDLVSWAAENRAMIQMQLLSHGAILFRNFHLSSVTDFQELVRAVSDCLLDYTERSSPRTYVANGVYTSTDHPPSEPILLHCEQSYTLSWPMKIWFFCRQPAPDRGRTPIADNREVYQRISQNTREAFRRRGVMYVRNYGSGVGLTWQEAFGTKERSAVEEHCRRNNIELVWEDGGHLRTRQVRPAIRKHPKTGEEIWFNHALFFNLAGLEPSARQSLLAVLTEKEVPYNTFYGDGEPIEASALEEIREAYRAATVTFPWQERDVLLVDNMLTAHGREAFSGQRRILVAMSEPFYSKRGEIGLWSPADTMDPVSANSGT